MVEGIFIGFFIGILASMMYGEYIDWLKENYDAGEDG